MEQHEQRIQALLNLGELLGNYKLGNPSDSTLEKAVEAALANNRWFTRCAGRRVYSDDVAHRHGKHAVRIVLTQILLDRKWQFAQIRKRMNIIRSDASTLEFFLVARHLGDPFKGGAQAFQLQSLKVFSFQTFVERVPYLMIQNQHRIA